MTRKQLAGREKRIVMRTILFVILALLLSLAVYFTVSYFSEADEKLQTSPEVSNIRSTEAAPPVRYLVESTTTTTEPPTTTTVPPTTTTTVPPAPPTTAAPQVNSGSVNWDAVAQCESGGNWSINTGNGYYGGLQFDLQTWQSVGGTGYPHEHSREEQIYRADLLYQRRGLAPWPVCGRYG